MNCTPRNHLSGAATRHIVTGADGALSDHTFRFTPHPYSPSNSIIA